MIYSDGNCNLTIEPKRQVLRHTPYLDVQPQLDDVTTHSKMTSLPTARWRLSQQDDVTHSKMTSLIARWRHYRTTSRWCHWPNLDDTTDIYDTFNKQETYVFVCIFKLFENVWNQAQLRKYNNFVEIFKINVLALKAPKCTKKYLKRDFRRKYVFAY